MDKIDGPYYFFGVLSRLAVLPRFTPIMLPDTGRTNIVPVDYVADALVALMHAPDLDGRAFHLTAPKTIGLRGIYRGVAKAAGLPPLRGSLPRSTAAPVLKVRGRAKALRNMAATQLGMPRRDFRRRRPEAHVRRRRDPKGLARKTELKYRSSPTTRPSCGGTGPSTSTPTARAATIRRARCRAGT